MASTETAAAAAPVPAPTETPKSIHSLIIDTGPLIKNDPSFSTLMSRAHQLVIIPSVIDEVRDVHTRQRLQNLIPFLTLRTPKPASVKFVSEFARKSGDLEVLSRPDLQLLALAYELDVERNGGDERLRKDPSLTSTNVPPAAPQDKKEDEPATKVEEKKECCEGHQEEAKPTSEEVATEVPVAELSKLTVEDVEKPAETTEVPETTPALDDEPDLTPSSAEESDDEGGWITPSNLKKRMDQEKGSMPAEEVTFMEAALLTNDFAMQNVALRIGLHIMSSGMHRITTVRTYILRCHGCFATTKDMAKQFCPRCGQSTLIRTSCATNADGTFKLFLKKNFQWNTRGNVYSIPKPIHGSANGKMPKNVTHGGHKGWGRQLILAEDQKEYIKANQERQRNRQRDLMDEDYLPSILTGERKNPTGRVRVGAGRNVNSKKRRN